MVKNDKTAKRDPERDGCAVQAEYAVGGGFGVYETEESFAPRWQELYEKMAATYGMTYEEYEAVQHEMGNELNGDCIILSC